MEFDCQKYEVPVNYQKHYFLFIEQARGRIMVSGILPDVDPTSDIGGATERGAENECLDVGGKDTL